MAHWAVRMNHKNRTWGFATLFLVMALHLADQNRGAWTWALLILHFLVYPQLAYLVARRASRPFDAELRNMQADALLFGLWIAALHFPLWIGFVLFTSATQNMAVFRGARGFLQATVLVVAGSAIVTLFTGWQPQPQTHWLVTALSIASLSVYMLMVSLDGHRRAMHLHEARRQVRSSEQGLQQRLTEIQTLQHQLREQANRDALTGLYNRRYLDATLDRELARSQRDRQPLSVMLIDIDHFKRINDTLGHPAGDEVLRQTAHLLNGLTRSSDIACRYGGEEFLLALPGMPLAKAQTIAETLRQQYADSPLLGHGTPLRATISIGLAGHPEHGEHAEQLIGQADRALYRAKHEGRNRVCTASRQPADQRM
jgi:diguanylate cyclase